MENSASINQRGGVYLSTRSLDKHRNRDLKTPKALSMVCLVLIWILLLITSYGRDGFGIEVKNDGYSGYPESPRSHINDPEICFLKNFILIGDALQIPESWHPPISVLSPKS